MGKVLNLVLQKVIESYIIWWDPNFSFKYCFFLFWFRLSQSPGGDFPQSKSPLSWAKYCLKLKIWMKIWLKLFSFYTKFQKGLFSKKKISEIFNNFFWMKFSEEKLWFSKIEEWTQASWNSHIECSSLVSSPCWRGTKRRSQKCYFVFYSFWNLSIRKVCWKRFC